MTVERDTRWENVHARIEKVSINTGTSEAEHWITVVEFRIDLASGDTAYYVWQRIHEDDLLATYDNEFKIYGWILTEMVDMMDGYLDGTRGENKPLDERPTI